MSFDDSRNNSFHHTPSNTTPKQVHNTSYPSFHDGMSTSFSEIPLNFSYTSPAVLFPEQVHPLLVVVNALIADHLRVYNCHTSLSHFAFESGLVGSSMRTASRDDVLHHLGVLVTTQAKPNNSTLSTESSQLVRIVPKNSSPLIKNIVKAAQEMIIQPSLQNDVLTTGPKPTTYRSSLAVILYETLTNVIMRDKLHGNSKTFDPKNLTLEEKLTLIEQSSYSRDIPTSSESMTETAIEARLSRVLRSLSQQSEKELQTKVAQFEAHRSLEIREEERNTMRTNLRSLVEQYKSDMLSLERDIEQLRVKYEDKLKRKQAEHQRQLKTLTSRSEEEKKRLLLNIDHERKQNIHNTELNRRDRLDNEAEAARLQRSRQSLASILDAAVREAVTRTSEDLILSNNQNDELKRRIKQLEDELSSRTRECSLADRMISEQNQELSSLRTDRMMKDIKLQQLEDQLRTLSSQLYALKQAQDEYTANGSNESMYNMIKEKIKNEKCEKCVQHENIIHTTEVQIAKLKNALQDIQATSQTQTQQYQRECERVLLLKNTISENHENEEKLQTILDAEVLKGKNYELEIRSLRRQLQSYLENNNHINVGKNTKTKYTQNVAQYNDENDNIYKNTHSLDDNVFTPLSVLSNSKYQNKNDLHLNTDMDNNNNNRTKSHVNNQTFDSQRVIPKNNTFSPLKSPTKSVSFSKKATSIPVSTKYSYSFDEDDGDDGDVVDGDTATATAIINTNVDFADRPQPTGSQVQLRADLTDYMNNNRNLKSIEDLLKEDNESSSSDDEDSVLDSIKEGDGKGKHNYGEVPKKLRYRDLRKTYRDLTVLHEFRRQYLQSNTDQTLESVTVQNDARSAAEIVQDELDQLKKDYEQHSQNQSTSIHSYMKTEPKMSGNSSSEEGLDANDSSSSDDSDEDSSEDESSNAYFNDDRENRMKQFLPPHKSESKSDSTITAVQQMAADLHDYMDNQNIVTKASALDDLEDGECDTESDDDEDDTGANEDGKGKHNYGDVPKKLRYKDLRKTYRDLSVLEEFRKLYVHKNAEDIELQKEVEENVKILQDLHQDAEDVYEEPSYNTLKIYSQSFQSTQNSASDTDSDKDADADIEARRDKNGNRYESRDSNVNTNSKSKLKVDSNHKDNVDSEDDDEDGEEVHYDPYDLTDEKNRIREEDVRFAYVDDDAAMNEGQITFSDTDSDVEEASSDEEERLHNEMVMKQYGLSHVQPLKSKAQDNRNPPPGAVAMSNIYEQLGLPNRV